MRDSKAPVASLVARQHVLKSHETCLCGMCMFKGDERAELGSLKGLTRRGRQEQDPKGPGHTGVCTKNDGGTPWEKSYKWSKLSHVSRSHSEVLIF